jgi:CHAT domain-containing protein
MNHLCFPTLVLSLGLALTMPASNVPATTHGAEPPEPTLQHAEQLRKEGLLLEAEPILRRIAQQDDPRGRAEAELALGNLLIQRRQRAEARETLSRAASQAQAIDALGLLARIENSLAHVHAAEGASDDALSAWNRAESHARGSEDLLLQIQVSRASYQSRQAPQEGFQALVKALRSGLAVEPGDVRDQALLSAAHQLVNASTPPMPGDWQHAIHSALTEVSASAMQRGDARYHAQALGTLGHLYETQRRWQEALALTRQAIAALQQQQEPDLLFRWEWQRGRILKAMNNSQQALAAYRRAVYRLESIREEIPVEYADGRSSFRETLEPLYLGLAELLLDEADQTSEEAEIARLLREARETQELLKVAELEDYFKDPCLASSAGSDKVLEQIQAGTAVLYPILLEERIVVILSDPQRIRHFSVPVTRQALNNTASEMRRHVQNARHFRFIRPAQQLYDWLMRPLEETLAQWQIDTLVVVPDGKLRSLPFSALHDGNQFLIQRLAVVTSPGLRLTDPQPIAWDQSQVLLAGLSDAVQGFSPLPGVEQELTDLQGLTRGDAILNQEYQLDQLNHRLDQNPYQVLHLATHGQFTGDPEKNFVLTYDDKLTMSRLETLIAGRGSDTPVELLTLSACQTALGDDRAALGLAGLAVKAGARSAIATLWLVNDEASAELMSSFYRNLYAADSLTKAKAMQQAQVALLSQPRHAHPSFWSPFLLIGNWL